MHVYITFYHFSDDMIIFLPNRSCQLPKARTMIYTFLYPTETLDPISVSYSLPEVLWNN